MSDGLDVLLVEDDRIVAQMYGHKLTADGYQVRYALDGPSGLRAAQDRLPGIMLLDLRLPRFHGLELLAQLREAPGGGELPVIVLSNYGERSDIERGQALGVLEHLIKSQTTPGDLVQTIRRLLPTAAAGAPSAGCG